MNTGVFMVPWSVSSTPARAALSVDFPMSSNFKVVFPFCLFILWPYSFFKNLDKVSQKHWARQRQILFFIWGFCVDQVDFVDDVDKGPWQCWSWQIKFILLYGQSLFTG